jgi:hypothetical protein
MIGGLRARDDRRMVALLTLERMFGFDPGGADLTH